MGTGMVGAPECGDVMKLQMKVNPDDRRHRRRQVQDVRLRQRDRQLFARHRMAEGQDRRRSAADQEHRDRQRAEPAAGEDSLLGAGRGRHQGGDHRLQEEAGDDDQLRLSLPNNDHGYDLNEVRQSARSSDAEGGREDSRRLSPSRGHRAACASVCSAADARD